MMQKSTTKPCHRFEKKYIEFALKLELNSQLVTQVKTSRDIHSFENVHKTFFNERRNRKVREKTRAAPRISVNYQRNLP